MQFLRRVRAAYRTSTQTHMVKHNCSWPRYLTLPLEVRDAGTRRTGAATGRATGETRPLGAARGWGGRAARRRRGPRGAARGRGGRPRLGGGGGGERGEAERGNGRMAQGWPVGPSWAASFHGLNCRTYTFPFPATTGGVVGGGRGTIC